MTKKDYVAQIMDEWYVAMDKENVGVQPKASTILGTILAGYKISPNHDKRDVWAEAMTIKGGDFPEWYNSLNVSEKKEYEEGRLKAKALYDPRERSLLKG